MSRLGSPYGLAAAVWTRDIFRAFRVVKSFRAGIIWVNHMQPTYVEAPWGGYKQSGFGRELGPWGLEEYLETKQVFVSTWTRRRSDGIRHGSHSDSHWDWGPAVVGL